MSAPEPPKGLPLRAGERVLLTRRGILDLTRPDNVRIIVTFVNGTFWITDQRLLFSQDLEDPGPCRLPESFQVEIERSSIVGVEKKRLSSRFFLHTTNGALSIQVPKWREFADLLMGEPAAPT